MIGASGVLVLGVLLALAAAGGWTAGRRVVVTGRISRAPAQHLVDAGRAPDVAYVDLDEGGQVVAYLHGGGPADGRIRLVATVVTAEGGAKRPGSAERYTELQLDVVSWETLESVDVEALLDRLVSTTLDRDERSRIEDEIVSAGRASVPVLLAHLDDTRTSPLDPREPFRERVRELLARIVSPPGYVSPFAQVVTPQEVGPAVRAFRVADWPAFWGRREERTLASIREEMKTHVDAFWKARGTVQDVE